MYFLIQKLIFWDSGSDSTFFVLKESWRVYQEKWLVNGPCMFCISGFRLFDGLSEKPCAEHHELTLFFFKHMKCLQYPWHYATYYMENYMNDRENDEQI